MNRPRGTSIVSAALSSAAAFFVLTRSGLAGTLAGAAVASMVYTGTSHWAGQGLERVARWWIGRRGGAVLPAVPESDKAVDQIPPGPRKLGGLTRTYGPLVLGVLALVVSGYSLVTGSPLERVIIQERLVEKPVVQERVVIQKETVTVTVPVTVEQPIATSAAASPSSTTTTASASAPTTMTVAPPPTTVTTVAPPITTTTVAPPSGD